MPGNNGFVNYTHSLNRKCEYCNRPLRKIGIERSNGIPINNKTGKDWSSRKYHKSCLKKKEEEELYNWARMENKKRIIYFD